MKTKYILMLLFFFLTISNFVYSNEHFSRYNDIKNIDSNTDTTILPEPPSQISIDVAPRKIKISWALSISNNILGYKVYKGDSLNPLQFYATLSNSTTFFIDSNLTNMQNTYYVITSIDSNSIESINSPNLTAIPSSIWYVSTSGSDNGFGSLSSPYKKIQKAIDAAIGGETVQVSNGTYIENIIINKNITLTSPFHLTQNEADIQNTIIDGNANGFPVIRIQGGSSINNAKIQGFTIQNGLVATNGWGSGINVSVISSTTLERLIIQNNRVLAGGGGAVSAYYVNQININNVTIQNNTSNEITGGVYLFASTINISNSKFISNSAASIAAILCHQTSNANGIISNCYFHNNRALRLIEGSDMIFINNTFDNNIGRIYVDGNSLIINSVIGSGQIIQNNGLLNVSNSLIQDGINCIQNTMPTFLTYLNNLSGSPFFVLSDSVDFNLSDYSPLIGAGTSSISVYGNTYYAPTYDINNTPRPSPIGSNPDIGAFENPLANHLHNSQIYVAPNGNDSSSVGLESTPFASIQKAIDYALNGDQIIVKPGIYENCLNLNKSITLRSLSGFQNTILKSIGDSSKIIKIIGTGDSLNPLQVTIQGFKFIDDSLSSNQIALQLENDLFLNIEKCWFEKIKYGIFSNSAYYDVINSVFNNVDIVSIHQNGYSNIERLSKFIHSTIINADSITIATFPYYSKFYNTIIAKNGVESTSYFNNTIPLFSKVLIDENPSTQPGSEFTQIANINDIYFTNLLQFDFTLKPFSPAIGYGTLISNVSSDIINNPRPSLNNSLPDVGAYENNFEIPSNAPPKINVVNNISIDEDSPLFQVPLTGISDGDLFENQNISITYLNSNQSLFSSSNLEYVSDSTFGVLNLLPANNINGNTLITVHVTDDGGTLNGGIDSTTINFTITINPVNDAPVSNSDQILVNEGNSISILTNGMNTLLWNDTDIENNPLQTIIVTQPQHGILVLNDNGNFTYTHDGSETIIDTFTYKVSDGFLESNISTVSITINPVNDAPVSNSDQILVNEGNSISILTNGMNTLLWNDTDIENNPLQAIIVTQPQHGILVLNVNGTFTYTHDGSETIIDTFTYKVSDGFLESNTSTVSITINPVNDAPVSNSDQILVNEGNSISILTNGMNTLLWNDTDIENNPLQAIIVTQPQHGILVLNVNGTFTYTHDGSETIIDTFTYKVSDGFLESNISTVSITINPVNDAPVSNSDQILVNEGNSISILTNGMNTLLWNDTDIENNPLQANMVTQPQHGSLVLNIDGTFTYSHDGSESVNDTFTYKVSDGFLESNISTVSITINPVNDAPVSNSDQILVNEGNSISILTNGMNTLLWNDTDIENNPLQVIMVTQPQHGSLVLNIDGTFTYTHDGSETIIDTFTYKVSDGFLESNISTVSITIIPVNDNSPSEIYISSSEITENISNQLIGSFTTEDIDNPYDSHTFTLVSGVGDFNNANFEIINNNLFNITSFDYENQIIQSIRVKVTDQLGHTFEKIIVIIVNNVNDISINSTVLNSYCTENNGNGSIIINSITNYSGSLSFQWTSSNGGVIPIGQQNNQNLTNLTVGKYYLVLVDSFFTYIDSFNVDLIPHYDDLSICYVSSDDTTVTKNRIFINNQGNYNVAYYEILREGSISGVFLTIGTLTSAENSFLDDNSNNTSVSYKYKVRLIDSCGNVFTNNSLHKTILLQSSVSVNNSVNLSWTHYEGITYPTYSIYRKENQGDFQMLDQVASSNNSYNDQSANVLTNNYEYYIAISIDSCNNNSLKNQKNNQTQIKSNRQNIGSGSSINEQILSSQITLYPNPTSDIVNLKMGDIMIFEKIEIYSSLGQMLMFCNKSNFSIADLPPAIYIAKIYTNMGVFHKSLIKK